MGAAGCCDKSAYQTTKLLRQKIWSFIYLIYNHSLRNISTIYIYNKTSIKRNILTIKQNTFYDSNTEVLISP